MSTSVDLRELAVNRSPAGGLARRPRAILSRIVLPCVILGGFVAALVWSLRDTLWIAKPVTVVSLVASRATAVSTSTPLFQAAGWVEPRPQPVVVSALVEGIVEEILAVEGQAVAANQIVARLVSRDAEIALQRAEADVRLRAAELLAAKAGVTSAEALYREPVTLLATLAEADAARAKIETELARLPALLRGAEAKRAFTEKDLLGKTRTSETVPAIAVRRAESELEAAHAQLDEYRQQKTSLNNERQALVKRCEVLQRQLELKIDETRKLAEARASVEVAEAQLQQAHAARDGARLALERTTVRAKTSGQVLALVAKPGGRLMGVDRVATHDASTVLTMYDPQRLQVRADVRLDDVSRVSTGQTVRIETAAHTKPLTGRVLMATGLTDIQKNTLQVKVAIDNPPPVLKPDMLVQVMFMAPPSTPTRQGTTTVRLLVPRDLIQSTDSSSTVWLADQATGLARLRQVTLGGAADGGLVEILTGLNVGDRLIVSGRESLKDGDRIRISGWDGTLGRELGVAK